MEKPSPHADPSGFSRKRTEILSYVVGALMTLLVIAHALLLLIPDWRTRILVATFLWFAFNVTAAMVGKEPRPRKKPPHPYPMPTVAVVVAIRGGDASTLNAMLDSLDAQESLAKKRFVRPIVAVYVVENGEPVAGVEEAFRAWQSRTSIPRTEFIRYDQANKRVAQSLAVNIEREATVLMTIDGYTVLKPNAVREGLVPFRDPEVMSVGGLLYGRNREQNLLTRILDLGFITSLVVDRKAWSSRGAVAAHRGGLALYRMWIVKRHLWDYLNQMVLRRNVTSGDDRSLTGLAALEGKSLFRPQCTGTTLLPSTLHHASDRQTRWWRTHWIGSLWIIRRFKPGNAIWQLTVLQAGAFILQAAAIPLLLLIDPIVSGYVPWAFAGYLVTLGYVRHLPSLAVMQEGRSIGRQFAEYLVLSPLATLFELWLGVALLWRGMLTPHQTEWQPHKVEVSA